MKINCTLLTRALIQRKLRFAICVQFVQKLISSNTLANRMNIHRRGSCDTRLEYSTAITAVAQLKRKENISPEHQTINMTVCLSEILSFSSPSIWCYILSTVGVFSDEYVCSISLSSSLFRTNHLGPLPLSNVRDRCWIFLDLTFTQWHRYSLARASADFAHRALDTSSILRDETHFGIRLHIGWFLVSKFRRIAVFYLIILFLVRKTILFSLWFSILFQSLMRRFFLSGVYCLLFCNFVFAGKPFHFVFSLFRLCFVR